MSDDTKSPSISWSAATISISAAVVAGAAARRSRTARCCCRLDAFAFTANNVTYAVFGEMMRYWDFFPAPDGWGRVPVWGFADVVRVAASPRSAEGERVYGYFPMSTHLVVPPERRERRRVRRRQRAPARRCPPSTTATSAPAPIPGYDPRHEDAQMLLRPLFATSFLIDDFLAEHDFHGARPIALSSASSKTAIGLAFMLSARAGRSYEVVGLTSKGNAAFVTGLGLLRSRRHLRRDRHAAAGSSARLRRHGRQRRRARRRASPRRRSAALQLLGRRHALDDRDGRRAATCRARRPTFFFAPDRIRQRGEEWGMHGLQVARRRRAGSASSATLERWLRDPARTAGPPTSSASTARCSTARPIPPTATCSRCSAARDRRRMTAGMTPEQVVRDFCRAVERRDVAELSASSPTTPSTTTSRSRRSPAATRSARTLGAVHRARRRAPSSSILGARDRRRDRAHRARRSLRDRRQDDRAPGHGRVRDHARRARSAPGATISTCSSSRVSSAEVVRPMTSACRHGGDSEDSARALARRDWDAVGAALDADGWARLPGLLTRAPVRDAARALRSRRALPLDDRHAPARLRERPLPLLRHAAAAARRAAPHRALRPARGGRASLGDASRRRPRRLSADARRLPRPLPCRRPTPADAAPPALSRRRLERPPSGPLRRRRVPAPGADRALRARSRLRGRRSRAGRAAAARPVARDDDHGGRRARASCSPTANGPCAARAATTGSRCATASAR